MSIVMTIDFFFNFLQIIWGLLLTVWYIPQLKKVIITKNVESFSSVSLGLIVLGVLLMEFYALFLVISTNRWLAFLITNTLSLLCAWAIFCLVIKYKK